MPAETQTIEVDDDQGDSQTLVSTPTAGTSTTRTINPSEWFPNLSGASGASITTSHSDTLCSIHERVVHVEEQQVVSTV